ncbi:hypothetical protein AWY89_10840 [Pasteurella multocida subsp. multocida]|nr:hypothetical protein AWY89_10840 [Pasteurella multocida subsp. multocida]
MFRKILSTIYLFQRFLQSHFRFKNYIIFVEQPVKMKLWKIITSKIRGKPFADGISWEPQYNTRFHVVDKHTGQAEYLSIFIMKMSLPELNFHGAGPNDEFLRMCPRHSNV